MIVWPFFMIATIAAFVSVVMAVVMDRKPEVFFIRTIWFVVIAGVAIVTTVRGV